MKDAPWRQRRKKQMPWVTAGGDVNTPLFFSLDELMKDTSLAPPLPWVDCRDTEALSRKPEGLYRCEFRNSTESNAKGTQKLNVIAGNSQAKEHIFRCSCIYFSSTLKWNHYFLFFYLFFPVVGFSQNQPSPVSRLTSWWGPFILVPFLGNSRSLCPVLSCFPPRLSTCSNGLLTWRVDACELASCLRHSSWSASTLWHL